MTEAAVKTRRKIVRIDEDRCNGCGQCVPACAEAALQVVGGKARLMKEIYCDGLGACLGNCPQDAISIEEREADAFDEEATKVHMTRQRAVPAACPGAAERAWGDGGEACACESAGGGAVLRPAAVAGPDQACGARGAVPEGRRSSDLRGLRPVRLRGSSRRTAGGAAGDGGLSEVRRS